MPSSPVVPPLYHVSQEARKVATKHFVYIENPWPWMTNGVKQGFYMNPSTDFIKLNLREWNEYIECFWDEFDQEDVLSDFEAIIAHLEYLHGSQVKKFKHLIVEPGMMLLSVGKTTIDSVNEKTIKTVFKTFGGIESVKLCQFVQLEDDDGQHHQQLIGNLRNIFLHINVVKLEIVQALFPTIRMHYDFLVQPAPNGGRFVLGATRPAIRDANVKDELPHMLVIPQTRKLILDGPPEWHDEKLALEAMVKGILEW